MLRELAETGETRLLLTSREAVPEPLAGKEYRVPALAAWEARELLAGVLRAQGQEPAGEDKEDKKAVEALVEAVGGHPRSLVLLGGLVAEKGVASVTQNMRAAMAVLEARFPDKREQSLMASVRLSLARLPAAAREKVRGLGVFRAVAHVGVMAQVLRVEPEEALDLGRKLTAVGLADAEGPYLLMDPGLGPTLVAEMGAAEREATEGRWLDAMGGLVRFLYEQHFQDARVAHEVQVALGEMLAVVQKMEYRLAAGRMHAAEVINYVAPLESLVSAMGLPQVLGRLAVARRRIADGLPAWNHERFNAESADVERRYEAGDLPGALKKALAVHTATEGAGDAYPGADYDRALSGWQVARMLRLTGRAGEALELLDKARKRFAELAATGNKNAARMELVAATDKGDALRDLGRLDEAARIYEEDAERAEAIGDIRGVAGGRSQIGAIRLLQGRLSDALTAYYESKRAFDALKEPGGAAIAWHRIGMIHHMADNAEAAENAYKQSLMLKATYGLADEASTLGPARSALPGAWSGGGSSLFHAASRRRISSRR
jgi:tetratricopeptide (TPR) repeat protein